MNQDLHPELAPLTRMYARDLAQISPSDSLDARIGRLVARGPLPRARARRRWHRPLAWAAAASLAALAISAGIIIGMRLERSGDLVTADPVVRAAGQFSTWAPEDLSMWPTDSVAFTIPAEYASNGTLVAVDPQARRKGKRYWVDVLVSSDGTVKIERIVPADQSLQPQAEKHDFPHQIQ